MTDLLQIVSSDPASPLSVPLSGNAIAALLSLTPTPAALQISAASGAWATGSVTLVNSGNVNIPVGLQISGNNPGYFAVTGNDILLYPGGSVPITITFNAPALPIGIALIGATYTAQLAFSIFTTGLSVGSMTLTGVIPSHLIDVIQPHL